MCGIAGQVVRDGTPDVVAVARMSAALLHRGPDSAGAYSAGAVAFGMRRLSIIDVACGDQPISSEDGSVTVICNGEIYNFTELRRRLEAQGHRFATSSDVEVIVHLYEEHGPALVRELRGMFAFALWDAKRQRLVLARDRVGKKPLYYHDAHGRLSFASELAALLEDGRIERRVAPQAIDAYLALLYVPDPLSAVDGVRKLPPATVLTWEDGQVSLERYWRLNFSETEDGDDDEISERIRDHLREAVRIRLMSERPLGVFLSGGVDSAAVVAMMAELETGPIRTFSIGFESDRFDERPFARLVADQFSTEHTEHVVEPDALAILPKLITHYGDPFGDSSSIPSYYVAEAAAQEVTVALNGDGGDESFAGYNRYAANLLSGRLESIPYPVRRLVAAAASAVPEPRRIDSTTGRIRRLAIALPQPAHRRYANAMSYISQAERQELYEPEFAAQIDPEFVHDMIRSPWEASGSRSVVNTMLDVDVATYLPGDLLVKMDIATMANSLEARSPFLDHKLMEMAARLPVRSKVQGTATKVGLKRALRGLVPDEILDRPKSGFSVPLAQWVRDPLRPAITEVLTDVRTRERGVIRAEPVRRLLAEHASGRFDRSSRLWLLFVLELWHRRFIDGDAESALL
jgi:asparagine synthase (glutamine-hydrolysing)